MFIYVYICLYMFIYVYICLYFDVFAYIFSYFCYTWIEGFLVFKLLLCIF